MVKLDGVCEGLHCPFLTSAAHHGLNFILKEALEGIQREHLIEASPVKISSQHVSKSDKQPGPH